MATGYWLKLYYEILDDPKMGRLPDNLWRRAIELFLIAGESDKEGMLPSVEDMAWRLRTTVEDLHKTLADLERIGIVTIEGETSLITNFAKRQQPVSNAEKQKRYRERTKQRYPTVTFGNEKTVTDKDKDEDKDIDKDEDDSPSEKSDLFYNEYTEDQICTTAYLELTGNMSMGVVATTKHKALEVLKAIYEKKGEEIKNYLSPFWKEWQRRGYNPGGFGWLDWASTGTIPEWKQNGKPVEKKGRVPEFSPAELLAALEGEL